MTVVDIGVWIANKMLPLPTSVTPPDYGELALVYISQFMHFHWNSEIFPIFPPILSSSTQLRQFLGSMMRYLGKFFEKYMQGCSRMIGSAAQWLRRGSYWGRIMGSQGASISLITSFPDFWGFTTTLTHSTHPHHTSNKCVVTNPIICKYWSQGLTSDH